MKTKNKLFSVIMSTILLISMFSTSVFANDTNVDKNETVDFNIAIDANDKSEQVFIFDDVKFTVLTTEKIY